MKTFAVTSILKSTLVAGLAPLLIAPGQAGGQGAEDSAVARRAGSFDKVVLVEDVTDPIEMAIAPDGRVFFIERGGAVRVWNPGTETTSMAGFIRVETRLEDGMLGIAFDPGFEHNGWVYIYHSPPRPEPRNVLSRFTIIDNRIDPASEKVILEVSTQHEWCCHRAGSLAFGPDGSLYLSTGDNTNPFASDGYGAIDERPGREAWDAQRTSANTDDLRGKILRIRPQPDGTYTIPEGNLFPGGRGGRPEIYTMGHRNPYRITVDPKTGWLYWGEVGPDAGTPLEGRGPAGHDEFNRAKQAGNFGWPYFVGNNKAYNDYDFATEKSGPLFDPNAPVNASPNNTGARILPPTQPAFIWYPYGASEEFPVLGLGGRSAMAGPVYRYNPSTVHPRGLPESFDSTWLIYEWVRNWIMGVRLDESGEILQIDSLFPELTFIRPIEMELGPDGRLYVMEWGDEFWGNNENARIVRLDFYDSPNRPPVAVAEIAPPTGTAPLTVQFSASKSRDPQEGGTLTYRWDLDGDGRIDVAQADGTYTYAEPGFYMAMLTVTDSEGLSTTKRVEVVAGNTRPEVTITSPVEGGVFDFGEPIRFEVQVRDAEEGRIEGQAVVIQPYLGRDTHVWPLQTKWSNTGSFIVDPDDYGYKSNRVVILEAQYTDRGATGVGSLTGRDRIILQPRRKEAEFATSIEGARKKTTGDLHTGRDIRTMIEAKGGAIISYAMVNLKNIESMTFRVKPETVGTIEVRQGSPEGRLLGTVEITAAAVASTKAENAEGATPATLTTEADRAPKGWIDITTPVTDPGVSHTLFVIVRGSREGVVASLDWFQFNAPGVTEAHKR